MNIDPDNVNFQRIFGEPVYESSHVVETMTSELATVIINKIILEMRCKTKIPESTVGCKFNVENSNYTQYFCPNAILGNVRTI
jgi:hypothetical protein